jgi:hypothetical protein
MYDQHNTSITLRLFGITSSAKFNTITIQYICDSYNPQKDIQQIINEGPTYSISLSHDDGECVYVDDLCYRDFNTTDEIIGELYRINEYICSHPV